MKTPNEALHSTCLIDRKKEGDVCGILRNFQLKNMIAIKSRNRFGEKFVITKTQVKERIVRKKLF